jgi:hypothetical protein
MPDSKLPPIGTTADPSFWNNGLRGKLCYLHGWVLAGALDCEDYAVLHECTDEQILDSIIRMELRKKGLERERKWWQGWGWWA